MLQYDPVDALVAFVVRPSQCASVFREIRPAFPSMPCQDAKTRKRPHAWKPQPAGRRVQSSPLHYNAVCEKLHESSAAFDLPSASSSTRTCVDFPAASKILHINYDGPITSEENVELFYIRPTLYAMWKRTKNKGQPVDFMHLVLSNPTAWKWQWLEAIKSPKLTTRTSFPPPHTQKEQ